MSQNTSTKKSVSEKAFEAKELVDTVYNRMHAVLKPEEFLRFLNITELFHWYSCFNLLLIYFKFPQARYIAEYSVWKQTADATYNDPSRMVLRRSEIKNPIKLVAPYTVVNQTTRARKLIPVSVSVYDVQQMNELPIPESDFLDFRNYSVEDLATTIGFISPYRICHATPEDKILSHNVKGYCDHIQKLVVVDGMLPPRSLLYVLLHECANAEVFLLNYQDEDLRQLVVESIYYVLLKHFHLTTDDITFSYVSRFKNVSKEDLARALHTIQMISHLIIEKIEDNLECFLNFSPVREEFPYQTSLDDLEIMQGFDF